MQQLKRGEIWLCELPPTDSSIQGGQGGIRPMILCSNNLANIHSPVIHAIPITSRKKSQLPTHVEVGTDCGLMIASTALCEQSMLLPKESFIRKVGQCTPRTLDRINEALAVQFDLVPNKQEIKTVNIRYA